MTPSSDLPAMLRGETIWTLQDSGLPDDVGRRRFELTDLIRFRDAWYCGFQEGVIHHNHPRNRARVIRSRDGLAWETAAVFAWEGASVREPRFSITPEGRLMVNTYMYFVSNDPRDPNNSRGPAARRVRDDAYLPPEANVNTAKPGLYYQLERPGVPDTDGEPHVACQSVAWLSPDGDAWSHAHACPTGVNTWRWEVVWHGGMGYSVGYLGKDRTGTLYRTRDGVHWRPLVHDFFPNGGMGNETTLVFDEDGTACCLVRDGRRRRSGATASGVTGSALPMLGIAHPPHYTAWQWHDLHADYGSAHGGVRPAEALFRAPFAGPKLRRLSDGRLMAVARMLGPDHEDGCITLFQLHLHRALLTRLATCDGTTYGGLVEHDDTLWISYCNSQVTQVRLAQLPMTQLPT